MESEAELLNLDGCDTAVCKDSSVGGEVLPAAGTGVPKEKSNDSVIGKIEDYLRSYLSFPDDRYFLPLALFALLMHCWDECFDEVPYLSVSAVLKQVGKTRVLEVLHFLGGDDRVAMEDGSITMAALCTRIDQHKVIFIDEAERFNNSTSPFRPILNGGYRRGQTVSRKIGGQIVEFSNFCPKGFVTIGDLYDSLRDRCIVVLMTRAASDKRKAYVRKEAKAEGNALGVALSQLVKEEQENIAGSYARYHDRYPTLGFLAERDQEIWKPLFTLCQVFAPGRIGELERSAVDISTLKTLPVRRLNDLKDEDGKAEEAHYAEKLLRDAALVMGHCDRMATSELIRSLRALNTSPWRSYRGTGVGEDTAGTMVLSGLLSRFGVEPKTIRVKPKSEPQSTAKGYTRQDLIAGAERAGVSLPTQNSCNPVTLAGKSAAECNGSTETEALPDVDCGGCGDLHRENVEMKEASPRWDGYRPAAPTPTTTATSEFATDSTITAATFSTRNTTTVNKRSQYSTSPSTAAYYPPSKSNEWYTPALHVDAVRALFDGRIELDPASCQQANEVVRAERYYSLAEDGLAQPWNAETLFLNPPYGGQAGVWAQRLISEYKSGNVGQAILLVYACTSESWFQPLYKYPICFAEKRLRFYGPDGKGYTAPKGSAFVYLGNNPARFTSVFSNLGQVVVPIRASDADQPETHSGTVMTSDPVQGLEPTSTTVTAVEVADAEPAPTEVGTATAVADELEPEVNSWHANAVQAQTCTPGPAETGNILAAPQTGINPEMPNPQVIQVGTSTIDARGPKFRKEKKLLDRSKPGNSVHE